jgi:hypothetical protein
LETSVGSCSKENSLVSTKLAESKKIIVSSLDKIMENFDFKASSDQFLPDFGWEDNFDSISNYSEENFTARYGSVSSGSEDEWIIYSFVGSIVN